MEVKARSGGEFGGGADAVDRLKQGRVAAMAADYLARRRLHDGPCRFDVVTVDVDRDPPRIEVYPQAFDAPW